MENSGQLNHFEIVFLKTQNKRQTILKTNTGLCEQITDECSGRLKVAAVYGAANDPSVLTIRLKVPTSEFTFKTLLRHC